MGPRREDFTQFNSLGGLQNTLGQTARSLGAAAREESNDMLAEFVQKLMTLAEPTFHEEDGRVYASKSVVELQPPLVKPIEVQTLAGFRDLYKLRDSSEPPVIILIEDHAHVHLITKQVDEWKRRSALVKAALPSDAPKFRFGTYMDPEEFIVGLMTLFEDSEYGTDHKKIVKLASSLAAEAVTISSDDGFSQSVVTKQGMVSKAEEKVSPRVSLSPYRTFREVSQPHSEFILRLRGRAGMMPSCALFEADGGEWRNDALKNIRAYFEKELPDADIVA